MKTTYNIITMLMIASISLLSPGCKKTSTTPVVKTSNPVNGTADARLIGNWLLKKTEQFNSAGTHYNTFNYTSNTCHYNFKSNVSGIISGYFASVNALSCMDLDDTWKVLPGDTLDQGLGKKYKILLVNSDSLVFREVYNLPTTSQIYHLSRL